MWEDKETTAPDPSVAPDGEQPSALARTDSIATFEETNKQFGKMRIFSMPELMDTHSHPGHVSLKTCCQRGHTSSLALPKSANPSSSCKWPIR